LYLKYFGLNEAPFAITPDPAFVYLSAAHRDALAHLMYGVGQGGSGGFVQLTGEVGTGKTTLCRCLLEQVPEDCQVALILNSLMTPQELLATICEELGIDTTGRADSNKALVDALNAYLLAQHAVGRRVVVVIDEAQNLSPEALEQVRLLTNLETSKDKLLQMVLLGQPELRQLLQRQNLRQLAQRITARYHLSPLSEEETRAYVSHRLRVAGAPRSPFRRSALRALYQRSGGIPRLINIIADRALAAAYARESAYVSARMVNAAANEVQPSETRIRANPWPAAAAAAVVLALALVAVAWGPAVAERWSRSVPGAAQGPMDTEPAAELPATVTPPAATAQAAPSPATVADATAAVAAVEPATGAGDATGAVVESIPPGEPVVGAATVAPAASSGQPLDRDFLERQSAFAWPGLAGLWGEADGAVAIQAACNGALRTGFACVGDTGNWSRIRQLGLPVILVLRDPEARLLLLGGFSGDELLIGAGEAAARVSRQDVEARWLGEYYVAWPQASDWPQEIRRGESGAAVDIVMEMAGMAEPAWGGGPEFDGGFEDWVKSFQRRHGLRADGIIGPNTLIRLMAPTITEPRLVVEDTERS